MKTVLSILYGLGFILMPLFATAANNESNDDRLKRLYNGLGGSPRTLGGTSPKSTLDDSKPTWSILDEGQPGPSSALNGLHCESEDKMDETIALYTSMMATVAKATEVIKESCDYKDPDIITAQRNNNRALANISGMLYMYTALCYDSRAGFNK